MSDGPSGLALAGEYYREVVAPLLLGRWPGLAHAGARLGGGSEVLGLDDATSSDHDWGLRLTVLVDHHLVEAVDGYLERSLPATHRGWPTRFATTWDPAVHHRVKVDTPVGFATSRLGVDAGRPWDAIDWLSVTGQSLLEVTAGQVFVDTHGGITALREALAWYPDDVWAHVVGADWARLAQELPLLGRSGARGDDLGSRVVAARLVGTAMHLGFLLERRWPPYPKWLGTAFAGLPRAAAAAPHLAACLGAGDWEQRQAELCRALDVLHELQRRTGLPTGEHALEPFYERPFIGVRASVLGSLRTAVTDAQLLVLPPEVGSVEQWVDAVDVLAPPQRRLAAVRGLAGVAAPAAG